MNKFRPFKRDMDWKTQFIYWLFPILGPREKISIEGGDPGKYIKTLHR